MKSYKLQNLTILERDGSRDVKSTLYRAVILSEDNEMYLIRGYVHSLNKVSMENCAWNALQYFIGENTASYGDYEAVYNRILSPWDSFEL